MASLREGLATMNDFDAAYRRSCVVGEWAMRQVQGKEYEPTIRNRLASAAYSLALEHHRGLNVLVGARAYGSALTLLRPAVEAFAQGYWLLYVASDAQIDEFKRGRKTMTLEPLLKCLARTNPDGPPIEALQRMAKRMNDLTHGGLGHLVLRIGPRTAGPQYAAADLANAIDIAVWVASMSLMDIVGGICRDDQSAMENHFALMRIEAKCRVLGPSTDSASPDTDPADAGYLADALCTFDPDNKIDSTQSPPPAKSEEKE